MDRITSEYITRMPQVEWFGDKGAEARLRSFGRVQRKDSGYRRQRMVKRELPSGRKRGTEKNCGCSEDGHAEGWCGREGYG